MQIVSVTISRPRGLQFKSVVDKIQSGTNLHSCANDVLVQSALRRIKTTLPFGPSLQPTKPVNVPILQLFISIRKRPAIVITPIHMSSLAELH